MTDPRNMDRLQAEAHYRAIGHTCGTCAIESRHRGGARCERCQGTGCGWWDGDYWKAPEDPTEASLLAAAQAIACQRGREKPDVFFDALGSQADEIMGDVCALAKIDPDTVSVPLSFRMLDTFQQYYRRASVRTSFFSVAMARVQASGGEHAGS